MPKGRQILVQNELKNHTENHCFLSGFLVQFWITFGFQVQSKMDCFFDSFLDGFLMVFGRFFGSQSASNLDVFFCCFFRVFLDWLGCGYQDRRDRYNRLDWVHGEVSIKSIWNFLELSQPLAKGTIFFAFLKSFFLMSFCGHFCLPCLPFLGPLLGTFFL